jgi:transglutaminase-like putative cysteine protease
MKQRPWLLGFALVFWGAQVGLPVWGLVLGVLIEAARWSRVHWELEADDFRRLWNVTALLFLGTAMYLFFANEGWGAVTALATAPAQAGAPLRTASQGLLRLLQWLPILLFPFVGAYILSRIDRLPWESVSPLLRLLRERRGVQSARPRTTGVRPGYPYFMIVLFTASADYTYPTLYFPALAGLVTWALWPFRSRHFAWATWGITVACVVLTGYLSQRGLLTLYRQLESWESQLWNELGRRRLDPQGMRTDLEAVRRSKGSPRVVLRVEPSQGTPPARLREGVYTLFSSPDWMASRQQFDAVPFPRDEETWSLAQPRFPANSARVLRYTRKGEMRLALPAGTFEVRQLRVGVLETNRLTAAQIYGGDKLVTYEAWYSPAAGFDVPPDEDDLDLDRLREADQQVIRRVAGELGLSELDPQTALARIEQYFLNEFVYSLDTPARRKSADPNTSPLGEFLLHSKKGHCEFFATATTLLLRAAGVPSRYVLGWSVQEKHDDTFLVRGRHAHAWTQAYLEGRWVEVDTTPGNWSELEAARSAWWEPVYDRFSQAWLAFTLWRQGGSQWRLYALIIGLGVLMFMAWRELRGGRWRRAKQRQVSPTHRTMAQGRDSEFYPVLELLERRTVARPATVPLREWVEGLPLPRGEILSELQRILALHYRLRFDPKGLTTEQREDLRRASSVWMQRYAAELL